MKQTLEILRIVATLIPALIAGVKAIEDALPEKGQGAEKLGILRAIAEQAYASGEALTVTFEQVWPTINTAVSAFVALFNKTSVFRK